jgi:hypothetical protein
MAEEDNNAGDFPGRYNRDIDNDDADRVFDEANEAFLPADHVSKFDKLIFCDSP